MDRVILRFDVDGPPVEIGDRLLPVRDVDEPLELQDRATLPRVRQAAEDVSALRVRVIGRDRQPGRCLRIEVLPKCVRSADRQGALDQECAGPCRPVGAKSRRHRVGLVAGADARSGQPGLAAGPLREHPIARCPECAAVAGGALPAREPAIDAAESALGVGGGLRDDIDHAVHRIGAPDRRARSADDFYPLDVIDHHVLFVPEHAREETVVGAAAIYQDEELVRAHGVEPAHGHRPLVRVDLPHVNAGRQPEEVGNTGHSGTANVIVRDDEDGRGNVRGPLLLARDRRDVDPHQVLDRHLAEVGRRNLCPGRR